jgi:lambda repressor-like predicted transcriptional regulator
MKQNLKIGFVALVVAGIAASGIALAQSDETDDTVPPGDAPIESVSPEGRGMGFRGHGGHHGMRDGYGHLGQVADILGVEADVIADELEAGATLAEVAEANGSSGAALVDALVANLDERLADAVADEKLTQERADEILANTEEKITELVNSTQEEIQAAREERMAERQAEREAGRAERRQTLSDVIGIPFEDIQAALQAGETTLADIAADVGVDLDTLVSGLVAPVAEDLQAKVADGTLTQDEADERLAKITERITERVQTVPGEGDFGHRGRRGGRGFRGGPAGNGFGGFGGGVAPAPTTGAVLST